MTRRREGGRNVAYFAGCTAGYLFPEVGRATVEVLEHNGIIVYVPKQQCCGMPQLVEGNRTATLDQVQCNMENLLAAVQVGDDLVCSCPSCGYLMNEPIGSMTQFARKFLA
ncbi:MAG: heterodisulfide reductase-related iron-sulfur binding cluster [Desulfuromonadales bacterium]|nr:heterodisulfide reductase-related iron-sulfur binding cluster [Desulfuromonadales bacterium]